MAAAGFLRLPSAALFQEPPQSAHLLAAVHTSGSYTLWIYYPGLTSQTLYTVINDFVEPKLKQVGADVTALRNKRSARTRDDEKQFEALQAFELELIELRDTLLKLAPTYKPNHDDGVRIIRRAAVAAVPPQALAEGAQGHLGQAGKRRLRLGASGHELLARSGARKVQDRQKPCHRTWPRRSVHRARGQTEKGTTAKGRPGVMNEYC